MNGCADFAVAVLQGRFVLNAGATNVEKIIRLEHTPEPPNEFLTIYRRMYQDIRRHADKLLKKPDVLLIKQAVHP
ncbi:MAG: hypothetical protein LBC14_06500 [Desulfovibrio sp.]|jgi:hypothetical protein|nr:hypothetical protein [Desulfovibrio sp.]